MTGVVVRKGKIAEIRRLRETLKKLADQVEPSDDAIIEIQAKLAALHKNRSNRPRRRRR